MTVTCGASSESSARPRSRVTRTPLPSSACAATAPRQTSTSGLTTASSASSHGLQARMWTASGRWWIRRLPCCL